MRDPLAPIIAGVDFSGFVNRYSFECEPFFTDAGESATMLDGSTLHDVFPLKARFSWTLNALSVEQYAALNAAFARGTVAAQIFDPTINAVRSAQFHVTRPTFVYNFTTQHYMSTAGSALVLEDAAPRVLPAVTPSPRPTAANRDPLAPVLDGYDLSGIVNRYSLQCEPFTTDGDNGGTLQDGSTVLDVLADKFRLSWTLNAISARQYADLCAVLSAGTAPDTVSATVYNPVLNAEYTAPFHVTFPVFRFALDNGQCMAFADSALVLEETTQARGLPVAGDDDWRLYDDGTLEIDPLPDGSPETEDDRWRRILQDIDTPTGDPNTPIHDVDRIKLNPDVPSLPSGIPERFPNLDEIVIPPNVEIPPDEFDNCPNLTIIKIVSFPYKTDYVVGTPLDYTGLSVVEISGDTERDITPSCVLRPAEGYMTTVVEDIMVDVRYCDKSIGTFWVAVAEVEVVDGGDWWTLYNNGLLDVYCVGDMPLIIDPPNNDVPWYEYNRQITDVTIRDSVTDILSHSFENCVNLTNIIIPDSITIIGSSAFAKSGLTSVTIPNSVTFINGNSFMSCKSLVSATLSSGMTWIDEQLFYGCSNLAYVTIPDSVERILRSSFSQCDSLTDIYYSGTEEQWNTITIEGGNTPLLNATIHYNSTGPT